MLKIVERSGRLHIVGTLMGERVRKSTGLPVGRRDEAEAMRVAEEGRIITGSRGEPQALLFREMVRRYGMRSEGVSRGQAGYLKRLVGVLGDVEVGDLPVAAADYVEEYLVGRRPGSVRRELGVVVSVVNWCAERGLCEKVKIALPKVDDRRDRWISEGERERLIDCAGEELKGLLVFLFYTGARLGEAMSLRWEDVLDGDGGESSAVLVSRKGAGKKVRRRSVPLHRRARGVMRGRRDGYVFAAPGGSRWTRQNFYYHWYRAVKAAGIEDFRAHDIRHTFASHFIQKTGDLRALAELLGHSSMAMVMRYSHLCPSGVRGKVDML